HPVPPRTSAPLTIGLPSHHGPDPDGVSTFRAHEMRSGWAPPIPRSQRCSRDQHWVSSRRLPPLPAARPYHPVFIPPFRAHHHEASSEVHSRSPVRPSPGPVIPRTERGPLGFFLELRTPSRQDLPSARRGGNRSRTLIRNYAPGTAGLQ